MGILHDFRRIIGVFHEQHDKTGDHIDRHMEFLRQAGKEISRGAVDILGLPEHHLLEIALCGIRPAQKHHGDAVAPAVGKVDHIHQVLAAGAIGLVYKGFFLSIVLFYVVKGMPDPADILHHCGAVDSECCLYIRCYEFSSKAGDRHHQDHVKSPADDGIKHLIMA